MKSCKTISLFSGCGGSDTGLRELGCNIIWANDIWDLACETYRRNIPDANINEGDICRFHDFPSADLLVGCYPCQGYTQGGRRNWGESLNFLYREFDRVLRVVRPKAFIVENVIGMTFGSNRALLDNQLRRYRLAGYVVSWRVLHAQDYGVPQERRRVFIVGTRSDLGVKYDFPAATHGPGAKANYASQREAIGRFDPWPEGEFNDEPFHWYYLSRNRRRRWGAPSPCIVGHWRHVPLHPSSPLLKRVDTDHWVFSSTRRARRLSYKECAALQGFPPTFDWSAGSTREKFQLIGNAVPPALFRAVAAPLLKRLAHAQ